MATQSTKEAQQQTADREPTTDSVLNALPAEAPASMTLRLAGWRRTGLGVLRIAFGVVWLIDAAFKWVPSFHNNLDTYLTDGAVGQPAAVRAWIGFWSNVIGIQPHLFGYLFAVAETALAIALIVGVFSNLAYLVGIILTLGIWSTAEGFGGPYNAGSVDIGAAIIYVFVFAALFLTSAGQYLGLDRALSTRLGRWSILASGPPERGPGETTDRGSPRRDNHDI